MWHVWDKGEVRAGFWWGDMRERGHLEGLGVHGSIILKWILQNVGWGVDWIDLTGDRDG